MNDELRELLKKEGKTQQWLADELEMSKVVISRQFSQPMSLKVMERYANLLGYRVKVSFEKIEERDELERLVENLNQATKELNDYLKNREC